MGGVFPPRKETEEVFGGTFLSSLGKGKKDVQPDTRLGTRAELRDTFNDSALQSMVFPLLAEFIPHFPMVNIEHCQLVVSNA